MQREERVTVQGPVKEQQPDGMSHRGMGRPVVGCGCSGIADKKAVGAGAGSLVHIIFNEYGPDRCKWFLTNVCQSLCAVVSLIGRSLFPKNPSSIVVTLSPLHSPAHPPTHSLTQMLAGTVSLAYTRLSVHLPQ